LYAITEIFQDLNIEAQAALVVGGLTLVFYVVRHTLEESSDVKPHGLLDISSIPRDSSPKPYMLVIPLALLKVVTKG
jgi:hypothetical protein